MEWKLIFYHLAKLRRREGVLRILNKNIYDKNNSSKSDILASWYNRSVKETMELLTEIKQEKHCCLYKTAMLLFKITIFIKSVKSK